MTTGRVARLRREVSVPMYRNAYALMLNTIVNSGLGLLYWIVAARTSTPDDVGRGNALISLMLLVSILTQADFGQALIRFLPRAGGGTRRLVMVSYGVAVGLAVLGATLAMAWCHLLLDASDPLHVSLPFACWFVVSTVAWSVFNLQDSALTGLRASMWIPLENAVYGVVKLGLLVVVARTSLSDGVFTSWTLPVLALLVPVNLLLFRRLIPRHAASTVDPYVPTRTVLTRYLAGGYVGHLAGQMSSTFLPVLVVQLLGSAQGGFFLPAQTAFAAMTLLSSAIVSSLVVEAAKDEERASHYAAAMLRRIAVTVWPAAVVVAVGAPWLLMLFGAEYRENATFLLQLLMLTVFPKVVTSLFNTRSRLQNRTGRIAVLQSLQAVVLVGGTALLAGPVGLTAVGWSALVAEGLPALLLGPSVVRWLRSGRATAESP
ncbi:lipopolysaccharide biosynthesis protein [Pseudonocardia charpentierae]|uniref:Oligosaccharide flippase family protein n=1 Tax=Pseudonocardia charpentierae TaxID=3075545 RepID=A0ABU2N6P1_9PSEU|nr:oligosaccharide flippase family protein [Pseudonocardia sp. DSM 45834]MDT0349610.1 oligosaccharide flippase family protein [Pseudonocardia sp. DSM 45834]